MVAARAGLGTALFLEQLGQFFEHDAAQLLESDTQSGQPFDSSLLPSLKW
jgi:hypothetical protein